MAQITSKPVPRQTIPYGDRPFVDPQTGRLTMEAYQFLQRLVGAGNATVENVGTVVTQTNANSTTIVEVQTTIETQGSQIAQVQTQAARAGSPGPVAHPPLPPLPAFPPGISPPGVPASAPPAAPVATRVVEAPPAAARVAVLPSTFGGTDNSAPPQDGQLLIGNSAEGMFNLGTITAGPNIVITNAGGGITIAASGTVSGGVSTIVAGSGLSGGTITTSGTIALGTIAADSLLGNSGTVAGVPSAIAIGANLTLSGGTLSAAGGGGGSVPPFGTGYTAPAVASVAVAGNVSTVLSAPTTGVLALRSTVALTNQISGAMKAVAGNFTFVAQVGVQGGGLQNAAGPVVGIGMSDGTKFQAIFFGVSQNSYQSSIIMVQNYSNYGTFSSTLYAGQQVTANPSYVKMVYSGTAVTFYFSIDGIDFEEVYTGTPYLTPTKAGVVCLFNCPAPPVTQCLRCYQWSGI